MSPAAFGLVLTGVLLNAVAQLALKAGTNRLGVVTFTPDNWLELGLRVAAQPHILSGVLCYVVSLVVWIMALSRVPVSVAYPMLSIGYVVNALAAWALFAEPLTAAKWSGIAFIVIGVVILARA